MVAGHSITFNYRGALLYVCPHYQHSVLPPYTYEYPVIHDNPITCNCQCLVWATVPDTSARPTPNKLPNPKWLVTWGQMTEAQHFNITNHFRITSTTPRHPLRFPYAAPASSSFAPPVLPRPRPVVPSARPPPLHILLMVIMLPTPSTDHGRYAPDI